MHPSAHIYRSARDARNGARPAHRVGRRAGALLALAALVACGDDASVVDGPQGPVPVASVTVSPATPSLLVGESITLTASLKDRAGRVLQGRAVTWTSGDSDVAEISADGRVVARRPGSAVVVATSESIAGSATVTVSAVPVARVVIAPTAPTLGWNEVRQLQAAALDADGRPLEGRTVSWTSSIAAVAEVSAEGVVTARSQGTTDITAEVEGQRATVELVVGLAPVARVVLDVGEATLEVGEWRQIAARLEDPLGRPLADRPVAWTSTDAAVLDVVDGRVTARRPGVATITAAAEGRSAQATVAVLPPPAYDLLYDWQSADGDELFVLGFAPRAAPVRLNAGNVSREPSASPDGRQVVFAVSQPDMTHGGTMHDLFVVNRDGTNMRWLTRTAGAEFQPAWSPRGDRIAFTASDVRTGTTDVWVMDVDGRNATNLTAGMGARSSEYSPAWSPDGARIAFSAVGSGGPSRIWIMQADGSGRAPLATDAGFDTHPTWSPDGSRLAFERRAAGATDGDIAIAPAGGGAATRLALPFDQSAPSWSPAGDLIAYSVIGGAGEQLWTVRPDGSDARPRTGGRNPSWIRR